MVDDLKRIVPCPLAVVVLIATCYAGLLNPVHLAMLSC